MRGLIAGTVLVASVFASQTCFACITYCRVGRTPPCEKTCPNTSITKDGSTFSIIFEGLEQDAVVGIPEFLKMNRSAVQAAGSSVTIKGLSRGSLDRVLNKLNADKASVSIPQ